MEVAYNHISKFFVQLNTVSQFLQKIFSKFFSTFYEYDGGYYLFITALLPFMLMFVVDILFSFIFSVRSREIRFFNVFSPKSWKSFNSQTYNRLPAERLKPSLLTLRYSRLSYLSLKFRDYLRKNKENEENEDKNDKRYNSGDIVRTVDGNKLIYCMSYHNDVDDEDVYVYKGRHGSFHSTLSPQEYSKASRSEREKSIISRILFKPSLSSTQEHEI